MTPHALRTCVLTLAVAGCVGFAAPDVTRIDPPSLPLRFESVQAPGGPAFRSTGHPGAVLLTASGIHFGPAASGKLTLPGAKTVDPQGEEQVPYVVNYLLGERTAWRTQVSAYASVRYRGIYPGIDLVFHGRRGELEFDFELSPGVDPGLIRLDFSGFDQILQQENGDLRLVLADEQFTLRAPVAFQWEGKQRVAVACRFSPLDSGVFGFAVGEYAPDLPLIIDPILEFSSYLGGGQADSLSAIVPAAGGVIYVAGWTVSSGLGRGGGLQSGLGGGRDAFVARFNQGGASLAWLTYLGGARDDQAADLEVDTDGNLYIVGDTSSTDFPTQNPLQATLRSAPDVFAAKLNPSGSSLIWSTYLGGTRSDTASAAVLAGRELVVAGTTSSLDFPLQNPLRAQLNGTGSGSASDAFLARLNSSGSALVFGTYLGGSGTDQAGELALTAEGRPVLVGLTASTDFPLQAALQEARAGTNDAFIAELAADGSALLFSTYLGGSSTENAFGVTAGPDGTLWVAGETASNNFPLRDPIQWNYLSGLEMFITAVAPDRSRFVYSTYLGGTGNDSARDVALDAYGRVVVGGFSGSPEFPLRGTGEVKRALTDLVVAVLDFERNLVAFSSVVGGGGDEIPGGMALASDGRIYLAGVTNSLDLPVRSGPQPRFAGAAVYYSSNSGAAWTPTPLAATGAEALHISFQNSWVFAAPTSGGLFVSKDTGSTWVSLGLAGERVLAMATEPNNPRVLYAGTQSAVYKTSNEGKDWSVLCGSEAMRCDRAPFTAVAVDPRNSRIVYVGTAANGVFRSDDGGENWLVKNNGLDDAGKAVNSLVIDSQNPSNLYLGTNGKVYRSTDGGTSWAPTSLTLVGPVQALAISSTSPNILYAAGVAQTPSGNIQIVARTADSGVTWTAQPAPGVTTTLALVANRPDEVYAGTQNDGLFKSTDGAKTWTPLGQGLPTRQVNRIAIDPRDTRRMYVSSLDPSDGVVVTVRPQDVFYFPQIAAGTVGRIRFQTAIVLVNTGGPTTAVMEFFSSAGEPMTFDLGSLGNQSRFEIPLARGGTLYVQSPGTGDLRIGYARITAGPGVDGTAIFSRTDVQAGVILFEAGVPATKASGNFVFVLDSLGDKDTGIALVRAGDTEEETDPAQVRLTLYDLDGNLVDETTLELAPGQHTAKFVAELFSDVAQQAAEMRGVVIVDSPVPLVALTLRQRDQPGLEFPAEVASLTPFPVVQPFSYASNLYFPQIANGTFGLFTRERFLTSFVLANPSQFPVQFVLEFFDLEGVPMGMDVGLQAPVIRIQDVLQPRAIRFIETTGKGGFQVGYARLRAGAAILGGTAVFTQQAIDTLGRAITLFEAGVPATVPRRRFSVFLDSLGGRDTGLALVNTSAEAAALTLRLYDLDFGLLAEQALELAPGQHLPRFISQLFPNYPPAGEMLGLVTVESSVPVAVVTLRQKNEIGVDFPQEVPLLTTFPVIPGVPLP